ncbi:hypothetical protein ETC03_15620 [Geobacillus sp. MMMUD3]|nr:hypothetical protein [Geobacillus sp. MMMUD3]
MQSEQVWPLRWEVNEKEKNSSKIIKYTFDFIFIQYYNGYYMRHTGEGERHESGNHRGDGIQRRGAVSLVAWASAR